MGETFLKELELLLYISNLQVAQLLHMEEKRNQKTTQISLKKKKPNK